MKTPINKKMDLDLSEFEVERALHETRSKLSLIKQVSVPSTRFKPNYIEHQYESAVHLAVKSNAYRITQERKRINQVILSTRMDSTKNNTPFLSPSGFPKGLSETPKVTQKNWYQPQVTMEHFNVISPRDPKKKVNNKKIFYDFNTMYSVKKFQADVMPTVYTEENNMTNETNPAVDFEKAIQTVLSHVANLKNPREVLQSLIVQIPVNQEEAEKQQNKDDQKPKINPRLINVKMNITDGEGRFKTIKHRFNPGKIQKQIIQKYSNFLVDKNIDKKNLVKNMTTEYSKTIERIQKNVAVVKVPRSYKVWLQDYNDFYQYGGDGEGENQQDFPDYLVERQLDEYLNRKLMSEASKLIGEVNSLNTTMKNQSDLLLEMKTEPVELKNKEDLGNKKSTGRGTKRGRSRDNVDDNDDEEQEEEEEDEEYYDEDEDGEEYDDEEEEQEDIEGDYESEEIEGDEEKVKQKPQRQKFRKREVQTDEEEENEQSGGEEGKEEGENENRPKGKKEEYGIKTRSITKNYPEREGQEINDNTHSSSYKRNLKLPAEKLAFSQEYKHKRSPSDVIISSYRKSIEPQKENERGQNRSIDVNERNAYRNTEERGPNKIKISTKIRTRNESQGTDSPQSSFQQKTPANLSKQSAKQVPDQDQMEEDEDNGSENIEKNTKSTKSPKKTRVRIVKKGEKMSGRKGQSVGDGQDIIGVSNPNSSRQRTKNYSQDMNSDKEGRRSEKSPEKPQLSKKGTFERSTPKKPSDKSIKQIREKSIKTEGVEDKTIEEQEEDEENRKSLKRINKTGDTQGDYTDNQNRVLATLEDEVSEPEEFDEEGKPRSKVSGANIKGKKNTVSLNSAKTVKAVPEPSRLGKARTLKEAEVSLSRNNSNSRDSRNGTKSTSKVTSSTKVQGVPFHIRERFEREKDPSQPRTQESVVSPNSRSRTTRPAFNKSNTIAISESPKRPEKPRDNRPKVKTHGEIRESDEEGGEDEENVNEEEEEGEGEEGQEGKTKKKRSLTKDFDLDKFLRDLQEKDKKKPTIIDMLLQSSSVLENDIQVKLRDPGLKLPQHLKFESREYESLFKKIYVWHNNLKDDLNEDSGLENLSEFQDSDGSDEDEDDDEENEEEDGEKKDEDEDEEEDSDEKRKKKKAKAKKKKDEEDDEDDSDEKRKKRKANKRKEEKEKEKMKI